MRIERIYDNRDNIWEKREYMRIESRMYENRETTWK